MPNRPCFLRLRLEPIFFIGRQLMECYLVVQEATLEQLVFKTRGNRLKFLKLLQQRIEKGGPLVSQDNIQLAIGQWKRRIQVVIKKIL
jgi:hypothetical protein